MLLIKRCSVLDLEESISFPALLDEYGRESSVKGMPEPKAKMEVYRACEAAGTLHCIGAWFDGVLIGFIVMLIPVLPHYGVSTAISESYFVTKPMRKTGAGSKLRYAAEVIAEKLGSPGLVINAPTGSDLAAVMEKKKFYKDVGRVFFRSFRRA